MEAIKISVNSAQAVLEHAPVITCGMVGVPVEITFDQSWEGLQKTLVYKAGGIVRDQLGVENTGTVPGQVLQTPYRSLQIGVYGASADGAVVIPTVWVNVGQIREGATPCGDPGTQPALPVWQQLLSRIEQLEENGNVQVDLSGYLTREEAEQVIEDLDIPTKAYVYEEAESVATKIVDETLGDISTALDHIIALQEELIGT